MQATILHIESRERERMSIYGRLGDFTYRLGEQVDPQQIIDNPNLTLYCLDETKQQAIFVELPENINLSSEPFCYQAQFENAKHLVAVPYGTLHELAQQIEIDTSRLIAIHNIGRCGSTLLNQIFNRLFTRKICKFRINIISE